MCLIFFVKYLLSNISFIRRVLVLDCVLQRGHVNDIPYFVNRILFIHRWLDTIAGQIWRKDCCQMFHSYTQSSFWMVSSKGVMSMPFSTSTFVACSSWGYSCNHSYHLDYNHGSWQLVLTISGSRCFSLARIQANSSLIAPNKKSWEILKIEKCKQACWKNEVSPCKSRPQSSCDSQSQGSSRSPRGLRKITESGSEENI